MDESQIKTPVLPHIAVQEYGGENKLKW